MRVPGSMIVARRIDPGGGDVRFSRVAVLAGLMMVLGVAGAGVAQADEATVPGTPCAPTARACVDLAGKQAWLIADGAIAYGPVPITSGKPGYRTPKGTFRVSYRDIDHRSREFNNAPMPYSVFFNGGIAFHQGSLSALSHGCIHLSRAAAQAFYAGLRPGDLVQVA
jgi:hypothetical protein